MRPPQRGPLPGYRRLFASALSLAHRTKPGMLGTSPRGLTDYCGVGNGPNGLRGVSGSSEGSASGLRITLADPESESEGKGPNGLMTVSTPVTEDPKDRGRDNSAACSPSLKSLALSEASTPARDNEAGSLPDGETAALSKIVGEFVAPTTPNESDCFVSPSLLTTILPPESLPLPQPAITPKITKIRMKQTSRRCIFRLVWFCR